MTSISQPGRVITVRFNTHLWESQNVNVASSVVFSGSSLPCLSVLYPVLQLLWFFLTIRAHALCFSSLVFVQYFTFIWSFPFPSLFATMFLLFLLIQILLIFQDLTQWHLPECASPFLNVSLLSLRSKSIIPYSELLFMFSMVLCVPYLFSFCPFFLSCVCNISSPLDYKLFESSCYNLLIFVFLRVPNST